VGIYRALIKIGASGDASITTVAGPVGEALIMTALGLVVAVPAGLAYNWLMLRHKLVPERLAAFTNALSGSLMAAGAVKPQMGGAPARSTAQTRSAAAPTQPGSEPLRTGRDATRGAATTSYAQQPR